MAYICKKYEAQALAYWTCVCTMIPLYQGLLQSPTLYTRKRPWGLLAGAWVWPSLRNVPDTYVKINVLKVNIIYYGGMIITYIITALYVPLKVLHNIIIHVFLLPGQLRRGIVALCTSWYAYLCCTERWHTPPARNGGIRPLHGTAGAN